MPAWAYLQNESSHNVPSSRKNPFFTLKKSSQIFFIVENGNKVRKLLCLLRYIVYIDIIIKIENRDMKRVSSSSFKACKTFLFHSCAGFIVG